MNKEATVFTVEDKCYNCNTSDGLTPRVPTPGSHGWQVTYECVDCDTKHTLTYGDKMGGGFDHITWE
jgi:RNase P subunit RPR2